MASFSKIIIVGNVGRDPELKMTPNGRPVCEFSVAVNRVSGQYFEDCNPVIPGGHKSRHRHD